MRKEAVTTAWSKSCGDCLFYYFLIIIYYDYDIFPKIFSMEMSSLTL